ncbi:NAD(P)/FAD-dependent oxidoreductase [Vulcanisaeta souniana]|nr:FAD-dependent oxidoreductase [Vulcanisaeta souniana]BDR93445.1 pyridine nucleotide-disulfide oxidoreductase [Vulcanisaeta souniana JCM 11219]
MANNKKRVVIIGGGAGGVVLANRLPKDEFDITIIDKQPYNYFLPWLLYIAFKGSRKPIKREIRSVLKPWVNFIQSGANVVNLQDRYVELESGKRLEYDYVVIATGASVDYSRVPGLDKVTEKFGNYHSNEDNAWRVWQTLNKMREGTLAVILAPGAYRCPPSPLEGVFLAEEFFRRRGLRDRVRIVFATFYPRPYPAEPMNELIEPLLKERGIDYVTFYTLDRIDPEKGVAYSMEGEELKFDSAIVIPPHVGVGIKYVPGDVLDSDGFVQADKFTNRVKGFDDAFVIGDASALPVAKTGVTAHLQAGVVAKILQGEDARNTGRTNCPFDVGYGLGTFVISDFYNPTIKYPINRINHLFKVAFAATYWDMLLYPELWDPVFESYFEATEPARIRHLYG